jgi:RluA family pseudouridine synthase
VPKRTAAKIRKRLKGITILYEDDALIVVDKPSGLLTVSTPKQKERTVFHILSDYVSKGVARSKKRVHIVHRLDKDTSGVLIVAKRNEARLKLQDTWANTKKTYVALVHGHPEAKVDTITSYLAENKARVVYVTKDPKKGQQASTAYRVVKEVSQFSLLEIDLLTGRRNQIRVHLASIGHPIVGDRKYGQAGGRNRVLALHARSISFEHPFTHERMELAADIPPHIMRFFGRVDPD